MTNPSQQPATELTLVDSKLEAAIQQANLEPATAQGLLATFKPLFMKAHEICQTAAHVNVTDATQVSEMKQARTLRLALRQVRIEAEKTRKTLKEDSLRRGKAIDGVYHLFEYGVAPVENRLQELEDFAVRAEAARKAQLKTAREELLKPYNVDTSCYALGDMAEATFAQLLESNRLAHEARVAAAKKAEEDRIAKEAAEAAERERIRVENERLKREAEEKAAAEAQERARVAALQVSRQKIMQAFVDGGDESPGVNYGAMDEAQFIAATASAQTRWSNRLKLEKERADIEAKAKVEREAAAAKLAEQKRAADEAARIEREKADAERAAADAKAKTELAAAKAKADEERKAVEAAAAAERQRVAAEKAELERKATEERLAREKLEAEANARREAEEKRQREEAEAAALAAAAPDREKLVALAALIRTLQVPAMSTNAGIRAVEVAAELIENLAVQVEGMASKLSMKAAA